MNLKVYLAIVLCLLLSQLSYATKKKVNSAKEINRLEALTASGEFKSFESGLEVFYLGNKIVTFREATQSLSVIGNNGTLVLNEGVRPSCKVDQANARDFVDQALEKSKTTEHAAVNRPKPPTKMYSQEDAVIASSKESFNSCLNELAKYFKTSKDHQIVRRGPHFLIINSKTGDVTIMNSMGNLTTSRDGNLTCSYNKLGVVNVLGRNTTEYMNTLMPRAKDFFGKIHQVGEPEFKKMISQVRGGAISREETNKFLEYLNTLDSAVKEASVVNAYCTRLLGSTLPGHSVHRGDVQQLSSAISLSKQVMFRNINELFSAYEEGSTKIQIKMDRKLKTIRRNYQDITAPAVIRSPRKVTPRPSETAI